MSSVNKFCILCAITLLIPASMTACSAPQQYYKNLHYTGNIQNHLNRDLQQCEGIARQARPNVPIYLPKGPTTTQGQVLIFDNHGNSVRGTYQSTTYPDRTENLRGSLDSLAQTVNASNIYLAVKNQCLADLGWYLITKEEYMESQPQSIKPRDTPVGNIRKGVKGDGPITGTWDWIGDTPINTILTFSTVDDDGGSIREDTSSNTTWGGSIKAKSVPSTLEGTGGNGGGYIQISSQPSGAKIMVKGYLEEQYIPVSGITPINIPLPIKHNHWMPECYKAILNGIESEDACFEDLDYRRTVNFIFE